jgi:predicted nuclease with RNAse H fold
MQRIAGLDLAATHRRPTGLAILDTITRSIIFLEEVFGDEDVVDPVIRYRVGLVVVDAPLSFPPRGRGFRDVERIAMTRGARFLPLTMSSMTMLAERAIRLKRVLEATGIIVIETHPSSSLKISGCSFSQLLEELNVSLPRRPRSRHEQDAVIAAITGLCVFEDCAELFETGHDRLVLLKQICKH